MKTTDRRVRVIERYELVRIIARVREAEDHTTLGRA
jgi:hypothetical protein